jgi:hypothetical protein
MLLHDLSARLALIAALALLVTSAARADAAERECRLLQLEPDGTLDVEIAGTQQRVKLLGITLPRPLPPLLVDIISRRIRPMQRPLRCDVRGTSKDGRLRARVFYFAWQDKSGDVWQDLAITLLDQGLGRVSPKKLRARYREGGGP